MMDSILFYLEGIFFMARKGQSFQKYTERTKARSSSSSIKKRENLARIREHSV